MGKRKYEGENESSKKKSKTVEVSDQSADINESELEGNKTYQDLGKSYQNHSFDIKHFRKELAAKQGQTMALTQFLQVCLNPDNQVDYITLYLQSGGNSHEILRQINQENKKNLTQATPAFHLFHLIILKVQSSLPHMITITEEACRYFLNTFMPTVEIMISENSGPRHRKIILKLLTSMVTLNPELGIEVLNQSPLTPKHLQYIVEKSNYKEVDNVRTAFVHFMTSFLVDGHLPLIKALLEKQGLLALVIPGLIQDDAEAVLMFLNILKKNVIENSFISKSLKLKTFSHQVLHNLFKVFSWKGPPELSHQDKTHSRPEIMSLLSDILLTLCTSHRLGLYFTDNTLGTAEANKNQNLYKAILTLKRPWENEIECNVILEIVYKCPDLHRAVINILEQSFEPQHTPIWERATEFVIKLLNKLKPESLVPRLNNLNAIQTANFVRFITLPVPLLKLLQTNLGKDYTISIYCVKILVKMLQSLRRYIHIIEMEQTDVKISELKNKLEYFLPKHLPTPSLIISLIQDVIAEKNNTETSQDFKLPKPDDTDSLIYLIDLLLLYNDVHTGFLETVEGSIDMKKILDFSMTLTNDKISILKYKIVSLWLMLDSSAISLQNPMFKELFLIMLDVYTNDNDDTWIEAKDTLRIFFRNTAIFEADEDEIDVILYTLRNSNVNPTSLIGDIVQYVLANKDELTNYMKSQTVHFEISDQSSEASLSKLFKNLMENKNTDDIVFLESKSPSPFIVGCVQYVQNNKEAKKNLKHFLSLYVANILHCNYSPELTEVFIGDLKLEARNYVASWIGQPVSLPETIGGEDKILINISRSVIDNEEISINDIFPFLMETSTEDGNVEVNGISYVVDVSKAVDSSELLTWAKYLIYCIIRLTNMRQLTDNHKNKISDYFECIITIAKKHHMIDVCRRIIVTLFKNPHLLRIYSPVDMKKEESNVIATKFILKVIENHADLIKYLHEKHNILRSYQRKNFSGIINAFIKISKRRNINSEHTINVLKIVGSCKGDDPLIFKQIFSVDINNCVRDDKEPSLALEILRVLIEKYSKSITEEMPQGALNKTMKLYTDLLTNTDVTANLTNLELTLVQYFENKPYQVTRVVDESFKKFFSANTIRKSTSQLACVLMRFNLKFANIFNEQLKRNEILGQRELTLPLGNTMINHSKFLTETKDFLPTIYNEYKSNIMKLLEKPHKAGQVYISSWRLIRKLVIECMELQDCEKIFAKTHKFETVEWSHIQVFHSAFLKLILSDRVSREIFLANYYLSMLHIVTMALKENKDQNIINDIISRIYHITKITKNLPSDNTSQSEELCKINDSAIWHNFCKTVLKDSLKIRTADESNTLGPKLLNLLTTLVKFFYPIDHQDVITLFDMVTSHSEFLNVMLSRHSSDIKSRIIELIYELMVKNKSVMKTQQIPVFLSAYHATRSPCDRLILSVLHYFESNGQAVNEYKPYVWGDSAANYYAVRKNRSSSLWAHPTPNQVLNLFEKDIIERTIRHFPVTQKLDSYYALSTNITVFDEIPFDGSVKALLEATKSGTQKSNINVKDNEACIEMKTKKMFQNEIIAKFENVDLSSRSHLDDDEEIYDPVFLFSLLSHLLAPGSMASSFKLLRTGLLSIPVMALSSQCPLMRAAAFHVLHRFCMLLETETRHKNDKLFLTDFISTLRRSLSTAIKANDDDSAPDMKSPRLPAVDTLYLAKALMVSTAPTDPLYKPVNNFFIAKQFVDLTVVPDFLSLFHDSDVEYAERRLWVLDVIRDGTKTMTDVNVIFKSMCLKMIMDFYSSVLCDRKTREKILGVINAIATIPRALAILVEGYGLIAWLHSGVRQLRKDDKSLVKSIYNLIECMVKSLILNSYLRNIGKINHRNGTALDVIPEIKINKDIEHEILVILFDLLQNIEDLEIEDVLSYIKVYKLFSRRTIKLLSKKQILKLISANGALRNSESLELLSKTVTVNDVTMLKSANININNELETELIKELTSLVHSYVV